MGFTSVELGKTTKDNVKAINDNFAKTLATDNTTAYTPTHDYEPATKKYVDDSMSGAGLGDMLKSVYDQNNNNIVDNAEKVDHTLTIQFDSGTTEGTSKYTFDGSATKSIDIKGGTNVTIAEASGEITISATDTNTVTQLKTSSVSSEVNISTSLASGDITLGEAAAKVVSTSIPASPTSAQEATLPSLGAVKTYVDTALTSSMTYKGTLAGGDTGSYGALTPAATVGDVYKVSTAGKIDGIEVEIGDTLICNTNTAAATSSDYATVAASWDILQGNIDGAVTSSDTAAITSGSIPVYDGTTGKVIHSSGVVLPQNPVFTDTVPVKTTFDNSTYWSATATDGVYTLTLTIDSGRYPVAVFNSSGAQIMVGVNIVSATSITIESYSKFAGYVILV